MTNLVDRNVHKTDLIIICVGPIDSANSMIGAQTFIYQRVIGEMMPMVTEMQNNLFDLAADLICNSAKVGRTEANRLAVLDNNIPLDAFNPLEASIKAVQRACKSCEAYIERDQLATHSPKEYLQAVESFLKRLSAYIATKAPWSETAALMMEINQKLEAAEMLCGDYILHLKPIIAHIKADLIAARMELIDGKSRITDKHVEKIETLAQELNQQLPPLSSFVIPVGASAPMHAARTAVRECEIAALKHYQAATSLTKYLNRMSDLIFIMCRMISKAAGASEDLWQRISK